MSKVTYAEDFALKLSSADFLKCDGVIADNGVLRGYSDYSKLENRSDCKGIVGATSKRLFFHTSNFFRSYDGDTFENLMPKIPSINPTTKDARYDVYRDVAYVAFDQDGVLRHDGMVNPPQTSRWAFADAAEDLAVVNERLVILVNGGTRLRFSDCGKRLYSDTEVKDGEDAVAYVDLPARVQAIKRGNGNVLYALGQTCFKVTFSADEQDVKITAVASGLDEVVMHTVAQVGDRIIFASASGLYSLRNDVVTPIFPELSGVIRDFRNCRANAWRGRYVLTFPNVNERCGCVLDVNGLKCNSVLCGNAVDICSFKGSDYILLSDGVLAHFDEGTFRGATFTRTGIDFSSGGVKSLRTLNITTKYDADVILTDGFGVKRITRVKGKSKPQRLRIYGVGRTFDLQIKTSGQTEISALSLTAQLNKGGENLWQ